MAFEEGECGGKDVALAGVGAQRRGIKPCQIEKARPERTVADNIRKRLQRQRFAVSGAAGLNDFATSHRYSRFYIRG